MKDEPTTGSPPMPDDRRVPEPALRQLVADLVRERPERLTRPIRPSRQHLRGDDPDVRLARRERARAVRSEHRDPLRPDVVVDPQHLVGRDVLGDADHRPDAGVDRLVDRVGREPTRHEDERRVRLGLGHGIANRVEDRNPGHVLAALARRDARDDVRPVVAVAHGVERALRAGDALDDEPRLVADDDRHQRFLALKIARSSRSLPSSTRSASSSRIRVSVFVRRARSVEPCLEVDPLVLAARTPRPRAPRRRTSRATRPRVVPHVRRIAQLVGFLARLAHEQVVRHEHQRAADAGHLLPSDPPDPGSGARRPRHATTSKLESANGISSARLTTRRLHPRRRIDRHDLEARLPAGSRATFPPPVATSRAVCPSAHSAKSSRSRPSRCASLSGTPRPAPTRRQSCASSTARVAASSIVASTWMLSRPASSRICRPSAAFVPSKRTTIGCSILVWSSACSIPLRHDVAARDAGEDVEADRLHLRVGADDLERVDDALRVAAAAEVAEVRGLAAGERDHVQRGHDQTGSVAEDPDLAVELHVGDALLAGGALLGRVRLEVAHLRDVGCL